MIGTCFKESGFIFASWGSWLVGGTWLPHFIQQVQLEVEDHGYFLTLLHSCYLCVLKNIASTSTDEELVSPKTFGTYSPHFLYYNKLLKL